MSKPSRMLALDVLRGLAVFLMMEQHIGVWLWESHVSPSQFLKYPVFVGFNALGGGAAPLFITLAGVGGVLFAASRAGKGWSPGKIDVTLIKRGVAVMGFGYLLNFLTPSWFSPMSWFVLHLMGVAMLLGPLWRRLPTTVILTLAAAILMATTGIQDWLGTPARLGNDRMRDTSMVGGALRLAFAEGQFPIFPWLALFLGGTAAGRWLKGGDLKSIRRLGGFGVVVGGGLAAAWGLGLTGDGLLMRAGRFNGTFYPCSPAYILLVGGLVQLGIAGLVGYEQRKGMTAGTWVSLGRASLTLLLVHVVVFRELSRPLGWWSAFEAGPAFAGTLGAIGVAAVLARLWGKVGYRYGAEWVLRKVAGG
ncbi:MAG: putative membrane protein [Myxococcota bacterium]|jgi:uncharacterized membrane protein